MKTLQELFEHELKDIYYAEHKLVEALGEMADEAKNPDIKRAFQSHQKETHGQIKRLEAVFKSLGQNPEAEPCPGIEGLIKEKKQFMKEKPTPEILDVYNIGAGQKSEHYEICAYECLIEKAQMLGMTEAEEHLTANLQEEIKTLDLLKRMTKTMKKVDLGQAA